MIDSIKKKKGIKPYLRKEVTDEGISVKISERYSDEERAIIKVDDYYNGQNMADTPKSVDFIVALDQQCDLYDLYVLELKDVNSPRGIDIHDIQEKFDTTIDDFLTKRFGDIFLNDRYKYSRIELYLVSDPYKLSGKYKNFKQYKAIIERMGKDSLKVDFSLGQRLYRFRGKVLRIKYDFPPNPVLGE